MKLKQLNILAQQLYRQSKAQPEGSPAFRRDWAEFSKLFHACLEERQEQFKDFSLDVLNIYFSNDATQEELADCRQELDYCFYVSLLLDQSAKDASLLHDYVFLGNGLMDKLYQVCPVFPIEELLAILQILRKTHDKAETAIDFMCFMGRLLIKYGNALCLEELQQAVAPSTTYTGFLSLLFPQITERELQKTNAFLQALGAHRSAVISLMVNTAILLTSYNSILPEAEVQKYRLRLLRSATGNDKKQ